MKLVDRRLLFSFILIMFIPILLSIRLFYLQIWQHRYLNSIAEEQISSVKTSPVTRGEIRDRNGKTLAVSIEVDSVGLNPKLIKNKDHFVKEISSILGINQTYLKYKINQDKYFVWLQRKIDPKISRLLQEKKEYFKGLVFQKETKRYYPLGDLTANIVGVVNIDSRGSSGIELLYDKELTKKSGKEVYKRYGKTYEIKVADDKTANNYFNVILTIDSVLQYIAQRELKKVVEKYDAKKGFVLIQNPKTGEILTCACYPSFDPNSDKFTIKDLLNPAINEVFEPGSVFKVVPLIAALSENILDESDTIYCENGSYMIADDVEINDHEKYSYLTLEGILVYSSNIGFAKLGMKIGRNKIYEWARRTGFGSLTGSMMPGEMRGLLPSPNSKEWSFVTGPIMCYGQGVAVTGLQIVNLYSAIANGGLLMEPRFVKSLTDMENKPICEYEPRVIRRIASEEIINTVRIMLEKVVMYGTGTLAKVEGYTVAGKTGTAQKLDTNIKKYTNKYISSFCGFIPSNNPELTILVVIDEPKKGYWASEIACPVFSNIAKDAMNYLEIQKKSIHNYAYNK